MQPFHLALSVDDLSAARAFYSAVLGCRETASADAWVDFEFFGHQLSLHQGAVAEAVVQGQVEGVNVPIPHFGAVLSRRDWNALVQRLDGAGTHYLLPPALRYAGEPGAQWTLFVRDPAGNALEFKTFERPQELFER